LANQASEIAAPAIGSPEPTSTTVSGARHCASTARRRLDGSCHRLRRLRARVTHTLSLASRGPWCSVTVVERNTSKPNQSRGLAPEPLLLLFIGPLGRHIIREADERAVDYDVGTRVEQKPTGPATWARPWKA
jgi:hypothetical protein